MICVLTELTCDQCENERVHVTNPAKARRKEIFELAKTQHWQKDGDRWICPRCQRNTQFSKESEVVTITAERQMPGRDARYWAQGFMWGKVIEGINLQEKGGYALVGENWLQGNNGHSENLELLANVPMFSTLYVSYASNATAHYAGILIETQPGVSDTVSFEFGRK